MSAAPPTVVEVALNGMTTREQNPHVPRTVDEIVADGLRCLDAGASVVHHHNDEPNFGGATRHCAGPYIDVWTRLRAARPGLLLPSPGADLETGGRLADTAVTLRRQRRPGTPMFCGGFFCSEKKERYASIVLYQYSLRLSGR